MYLVSDGFLRAVKSNTRKYYWTGTIVTRGGMTYEFGSKEIVKGSGYTLGSDPITVVGNFWAVPVFVLEIRKIFIQS